MQRLALIGIALLAFGGCSSSTSATPDLGVATADLAVATGPTLDAAVAVTHDAALSPADLAVSGSLGPYETAGADTVSTFDMTAAVTSGSITVHVYLPGSAGVHPVVVLAPGLQQPGSAYTSYGQRLASHGIVALLLDDPGILTQTPSVVTDLGDLVVTWLPAQAASGMLAGHIDLANVGYAGHSRGGQATLLAAEGPAKGHVKGWCGLDPVDSTTSSSAPEARTDLASIGVPTLFIGGGVTTSCSPAADNYAVLYAAAASPAVSMTVVGASHAQFEDPATCAFCTLCTPAGTALGTSVLDVSVRYLTAFFARELAGDASVGPTLDGAGSAIDVAAGRIELASK